MNSLPVFTSLYRQLKESMQFNSIQQINEYV